MIMEVVSVVILALINRTLTGYSYTAVAALGIFMRVRSLALMPVHGLAQGPCPSLLSPMEPGYTTGSRETIVKSVLWLCYSREQPG